MTVSQSECVPRTCAAIMLVSEAVQHSDPRGTLALVQQTVFEDTELIISKGRDALLALMALCFQCWMSVTKY